MKKSYNINNDYSAIAKFLHWSLALLIIVNYIMGLTVHDATLFLLHEQIGLTILVLVIIRMLLRLKSAAPTPLLIKFKHKSLLVKIGQKLLHFLVVIILRFNAVICNRYMLIYVLMIVISISGILTVNAKAYHPVTFWWLVGIPEIIAKQAKDVTRLLVVWHIRLSHFLMMIVFVHTLIALIHHYFIKDRLLIRMLPKIFNKR